MADGEDDELRARVLSPRRTRLAEVLEVALGMPPEDARDAAATASWDEPRALVRYRREGEPDERLWRIDDKSGDPRETWEALAAQELIPMEWAADARRRFHSREWWRVPVAAGLEPVLSEHPPTLRSCVTLASDARGVATAESLAREAAVRLAPWGGPSNEVVTWELAIQPPAYVGEGLLAGPYAALEKRAGRSRAEAWMPQRFWRDAWVREARKLAACAEQWRARASRGARVEARDGVPDPVAGAAFAELPNPFEPLVELFALGYALEQLTPERAVLVAREV